MNSFLTYFLHTVACFSYDPIWVYEPFEEKVVKNISYFKIPDCQSLAGIILSMQFLLSDFYSQIFYMTYTV